MCGLSLLLLGKWWASGCLWDCVDSGRINSTAIQLPREFFPERAAYGSLGPDDNTYGATQVEAQNIFWGEYGGSSAILQIFRYPGTSRAKRGFNTEVRALDEMFGVISQQASSQPTYTSKSADQFFTGCGKKWTAMGYKCVFVGRYREDLISFNTTIDRQMTLEDFEQIISYLDTVSTAGLGH
jgi:hypothetical protein